MAAPDTLNELLRLPVTERARLALELLRSLDERSDPDAAEAWDAEIERRGAEVDAGTADTVSFRRISRAHETSSVDSQRAMNLRLHRLAIAEIEHEVDYYDARQPGLGTALEDTIDAALIRITRFPEGAPAWKHRVDRRVLTLPTFPFTIPYQITTTEIIVLALAHTSRRPGYWNRRQPG